MTNHVEVMERMTVLVENHSIPSTATERLAAIEAILTRLTNEGDKR